MSNRRGFSRRDVLRGAGVALALPWLESMAPRTARGQAVTPARTFVAMSFPEGTATWWKPPATGVGDAWTLSPILEPIAPIKAYVNLLRNVGNYGPFGGHVEPSNSNLMAAMLTGTRARTQTVAPTLTVGTSVDQLIAQSLTGRTKLDSLQVGLSTLDSYTDGLPGPCSRSISWSSPTDPTFKLIDPQTVFDKIVGIGDLPTADSPFAPGRRAKNKSVLDYVLGHAATVRNQVSASDGKRIDAYLDSVRTLETRIAASPTLPACDVLPRPTGPAITVGSTPPDYNRGTHADLMIDLVVMALQCDVTRVVSFMLDDARSDFVYNFLPMRRFTAAGSTPGTGVCAGYDGLVHAGDANDGYATVGQWFVSKLTRLAQKLLASSNGDGNLLDAATIWFGSEMHGGNMDGLDLPILTVGKGGGRLKTNQYIDFAETPRQAERLANLHLTFMRSVFDMPITTFGSAPPPVAPAGYPPNTFGAGTMVIPEILV